MNKQRTIERLKRNSISLNGCRVWIKYKDKYGYGQTVVGKKYTKAHRASAWAHGILKSLYSRLLVCHTCDNRTCIKPEHLFVGTNQDNMDDAVKKNRMAKGSRSKKAKLTDDDVFAIAKMLRGGVWLDDVARWFGVSRNCINSIKRRDNWKHLKLNLKNVKTNTGMAPRVWKDSVV